MYQSFEQMNRRQTLLFVASLLLVAAFTRLIPHAPNFTSMGAVALLGGAWLRKNSWSIVLPIVALFASDLVLNNVIYGQGNGFVFFYEGAEYIYGAFVLISLIGALGLKDGGSLNRFVNFALFGGLSTVVFFLLSNFGVWKSGMMYPLTVSGLIECYTLAIPYAFNTLASTLIYGGVLMIIKENVEWKWSTIRS